MLPTFWLQVCKIHAPDLLITALQVRVQNFMSHLVRKWTLVSCGLCSFKHACAAIQKGLAWGYSSEGSLASLYCVSEQLRLWQDCTDAPLNPGQKAELGNDNSRAMMDENQPLQNDVQRIKIDILFIFLSFFRAAN